VSPADLHFIDLNAFGNAPQPDPVWKRCWTGQEPLWKVFWGWFVFGHGTILGCAVGFMVISMVLGFVVSPRTLTAGISGMVAGAVLLMVVTVPYAIWSAVSVWRCAYNCMDRRWGHMVRGIVLLYGTIMLLPLGQALFRQVEKVI